MDITPGRRERDLKDALSKHFTIDMAFIESLNAHDYMPEVGRYFAYMMLIIPTVWKRAGVSNLTLRCGKRV